MSAVIADCPVCGLALSSTTSTTKPGTDTGKNGAVGGHIHVVVSTGEELSCLNGHRWTARGDFILERIG